MKIHELSKFTGINSETIRMYREKGLLKPLKNPENGYYEYSEKDIISLFMIRKMRDNNFSLKQIHKMYTSENLPELIEDFEQEERNARDEILRLQSQIEILQLEKQHLVECLEADSAAENVVTELHSGDTKYDLYDIRDKADKDIEKWLANSSQCTIPIHVTRMMLSGTLPERIPAKIGIGTYSSVIRRCGLPLLPGLVICPPGLYLTMMLRMTQLHYIEGSQLEPLQRYAKEHHMHFISDTTAYLMRIDMSGKVPAFIFRVRIQVEADQANA